MKKQSKAGYEHIGMTCCVMTEDRVTPGCFEIASLTVCFWMEGAKWDSEY